MSSLEEVFSAKTRTIYSLSLPYWRTWWPDKKTKTSRFDASIDEFCNNAELLLDEIWK